MSRQPRSHGKRRKARQKQRSKHTRRSVATDILILSDGTVLAHNLTPGMANVLQKLNPRDETIKARAARKSKQPTTTGPNSGEAPSAT
jgi:hypothetical protein